MATAPNPTGHGGLFDQDYDPSTPAVTNGDTELFGAVAALDQQGTIKDDPPAPYPVYAPTEPYEPDDDHRRTISMTVFFLVLMVVYIGFCAYYRKVKIRRSVGDESVHGELVSERNERRRRQRRENQVVLDESTSAAQRARESAEEQAKLERRKESIKQALMLRLIVDDNEEVEGGLECVKDCECEQCRFSHRKTKMEGEDGMVASIALSPKAGIITIQEEDSDEEMGLEQMTRTLDDAADAMDQAEIQETKETQDDDDTPALAAATTEETIDSSPPPSPSQAGRPAPTPPSPPSRLSLPSPRKYVDALDCGNNVRYAVNTCSSQVHDATCGTVHCGSLHGSIHNKLKGSVGTDAEDNDCPTISLEAIVAAYGEECNICLSHFQVGDRAAWSNLQYGEDDSDGNRVVRAVSTGVPEEDAVTIPGDQKNETQEGQKEQCVHVFHEECISRWLLVRDGCPICRRSYFPEDGAAATAGDATTAAANDVDRERGGR